MKVAVIGATGFVGGYLVAALLDAGHRPSVLVRAGSEDKLRRALALTSLGPDRKGRYASPPLLRNWMLLEPAPYSMRFHCWYLFYISHLSYSFACYYYLLLSHH